MPFETQVRFRLPIEAFSTVALPACRRSTRRRRRRRARRAPWPARRASPVTMLIDAGGHVGGFEHLVEVGGGERVALGGDGDDGVAHGDGRRDQRDEAEQRRLVRAGDADRRRSARGTAKRDAAQRRGLHRAVVLVGPGGVGEQPLDGERRLPLAPRTRSRRSGRAGGAPNSSRGPRGSRRCSRGSAPRMWPVDFAQPAAPCGPPRRRCGCPCGCPRRPRRAAGRPDRGSAAVAGVRPRLLAADVQLRRAVDRAAGLPEIRHRSSTVPSDVLAVL